MTMEKKDIEKINFKKAFSVRLMEQLVKNTNNDDNIVVSPSRLQAVLVLLSNWTSPNMQRKILDVVGGQDLEITDANKFCSKDLFTITPCFNINGQGNENPILELSTILWLKEKLLIKDGHVDDMKEIFGIEYERVDFANPNTRDLIDAKINEASHGLIQSLNTDIDPQTRALLTDVLYFKAYWETPFDEYDTDDLPFYGATETVDVPTMCLEETLPYKETGKYQMVELSYLSELSDSSYVMRIFLPELCVSLSELLQIIAEENEEQELKYEHVCLYLPRFSVESSNRMTDVLRQLGLEDIFASKDILPQLADNIQIADIAQKVKVIVNETETEAAALTSVLCAGCPPPEEADKPIVMTVDRPSFFEIVEKASGIILFSGVINDIKG